MNVRLIEEDYPDDPYMNMAVDEAIFQEVAKGKSPPTMRFYRNRSAAVIGCFQLAEEEIDLEYANANSIKIAKRFTGGGAVYHDMGALNYSIISPDLYGIGMNVERLFSGMMNGAVRSLALSGVPEIKSSMNDITSNGKKVFGAAATMKKGALMFHATMLINSDLNVLSSVLKVPGEKLKDKGVKSIRERVANIKELCGKDSAKIHDSLLIGYSTFYGFKAAPGKLTDDETSLAKKLYSGKYSKQEWNMGSELIHIE